MDTGEGIFVRPEKEQKKEELEQAYPNHGGWFQEGEIIELRGSTFRVASVGPKSIRLKLLKRGIGAEHDNG